MSNRLPQFAHYLALMAYRTHKEMQGDCHISFSILADSAFCKAKRMRETRRRAQVLFLEHKVVLNIPETSLLPAEAKKLLARPGFRRAIDKPDACDYERQTRPLQRRYGYNQLAAAAKDLDWLFFTLLALPLDDDICLSAASFTCASFTGGPMAGMRGTGAMEEIHHISNRRRVWEKDFMLGVV